MSPIRTFLVGALAVVGIGSAHADDLSQDAQAKLQTNEVFFSTSNVTQNQILTEILNSEESPLKGLQPKHGDRRRHGGGSYFDWGQGQNGWGYCYEWTNHGDVLNGGNPVHPYSCEKSNPSRFRWSRGQDGWGYCYQYTPYGVAMNEGSLVHPYSCEKVAPSYYRWGRAQNGYTYCYQYTANGIPMNQGSPVNESYCR